MQFSYEFVETVDAVRARIADCEGKHIQQVVYSTFHDGLTQVCFGCRAVRSTIRATRTTEAEEEKPMSQESSSVSSLALIRAQREIEVLSEALRIACADAWPNQLQWTDLYIQRAKNNIATRTPQADKEEK